MKKKDQVNSKPATEDLKQQLLTGVRSTPADNDSMRKQLMLSSLLKGRTCGTSESSVVMLKQKPHPEEAPASQGHQVLGGIEELLQQDHALAVLLGTLVHNHQDTGRCLRPEHGADMSDEYDVRQVRCQTSMM